MLKRFLKDLTTIELVLDRHHKQVLAATLVVIVGATLGYLGLHGAGLIVEVTGLLLVALV